MSEKYSEQVNIRLSPTLKEALSRAAASDGLKVGTFIRVLAIRGMAGEAAHRSEGMSDVAA